MSRERFLREARSAASVKHPHIVMVYEVEEHPLPYIVMELVDGRLCSSITTKGIVFQFQKLYT